MTTSEWLASDEPDLMLEHVMDVVTRAQLIQFVRQCWERIDSYLQTVPHDYTVVEQFIELAPRMNDYDAVIYASEAALKAAGWAPDRREEQAQQARLLRSIIGDSYRASGRMMGP